MGGRSMGLRLIKGGVFHYGGVLGREGLEHTVELGYGCDGTDSKLACIHT